MKKLVLVDGINFFYRGCWSGAPTLSVRGEEVTYIYAFFRNFLSMMRKLEQKFDDVDFVVCWDGGYNERMKISSKAVESGIIPKTYKQERRDANLIADDEEKARSDEFKRQMNKTRDVLNTTRVGSLFVLGEEADDLIGSLVYSQKDNYDEIILVTTDKDYYQLLLPKVKIYNSGKNIFLDSGFLKKEYNLDNCEQWVDVGAIAGETGRSSDTIYGVPGISYITASKLIANYGTLKNLLDTAKKELAEDIIKFGIAKDLYKAVKAKEYKLKHHVKEMYVLAHSDIVEISFQLKKIRTWLDVSVPAVNPSLMELDAFFNKMNFIMGSNDTGLLTIKNYDL